MWPCFRLRSFFVYVTLTLRRWVLSDSQFLHQILAQYQVAKRNVLPKQEEQAVHMVETKLPFEQLVIYELEIKQSYSLSVGWSLIWLKHKHEQELFVKLSRFNAFCVCWSQLVVATTLNVIQV